MLLLNAVCVSWVFAKCFPRKILEKLNIECFDVPKFEVLFDSSLRLNKEPIHKRKKGAYYVIQALWQKKLTIIFKSKQVLKKSMLDSSFGNVIHKNKTLIEPKTTLRRPTLLYNWRWNSLFWLNVFLNDIVIQNTITLT